MRQGNFRSNNYFISLIIGFIITLNAQAQFISVQSGNWNNNATWGTAPGVVPTSADDVIIDAGHVIDINNAQPECNNLSFGSATSKLNMANATSVLDIYGDFTPFSTAHAVFSAWTAGAKVRFTGGAATQMINNLPVNANSPAFSFMELEVDKPYGTKVTNIGGNVHLGIGTSLLIISGTFELAGGSDIEGWDLDGGTGGGATAPTITVQAGGRFHMANVNSYIRSGNNNGDNDSKIGKLVTYDTVSFSAGAGANRINIGDIDIEDGGLVEIRSGGTTTSSFNPGKITVKNGGTFKSSNNTNSYWYTNTTTPTVLEVQSGGEFDINGTNNSDILPQSISLQPGSWVRYSSPADSLSSSAMLENMYNLRLVGSALPKTLYRNLSVSDTISMRTNATEVPSINLNGFSLTYGPSVTLQYRGIGSPPPQQTTTDIEWAPTGSNRPLNVQIYSKTNVLLNNDKIINGALSFRGGIDSSAKIDIGNFNLTASSTSGSDKDKYVKTSGTGKLTVTNIGATSKVLPIGNSRYNPLTISNGSNHDWSANVEDALVVGQSPFFMSIPYAVNRTWNISPSVNPPAAGADITFQYNAVTDVNAQHDSAQLVQVWHKETIYNFFWLAAGVSQDPIDIGSNNRTATITGWTRFSPFAISTMDRPLPVRYISFNGLRRGLYNELSWITAGEENNSGFEVQRSANGRQFQPIGFVASKAGGNSNAQQAYKFTDTLPMGEKQYYRLRQVALGVNDRFSEVILLDQSIADAGIRLLYPNPAREQITLQLFTPEKIIATLYITDMAGRRLLTREVSLSQGTSLVTFNIASLPAGAYRAVLYRELQKPEAAGFIKL